jgi:hypothetical protein
VAVMLGDVTRADRIRSARRALSLKLARRPWLISSGIEKDGDQLRLVVSVAAGKKSDAEEVVSRLGLGVPFRVREVAPVQLR